MGATTTFVRLDTGGDRLAVALDEVREIARVRSVTPVPRAPAIVRGVANVRGRVVTLLDLDVIYGGGDAPPPEPPGAPAGHAVVLAAPLDHLALFSRSRVDIGRGEAAPVQGEPPAPAATDAIAPPAGTLLREEGGLVRLLPAAGIAAYGEARILERYRRRP